MKLKRAAEEYLGEQVTEAVITVPAYFNDAQRQATKDAGRIAGLDVKRIINEPTAAALAYGLDKTKEQLIAVYDFGGGTFDISVLEVGDKVVEVVSTNGDTHLGGDDIDDRVMDWLDRRVQEGSGHRRLQGQDGPPAPQGGGGEGQDRAVERAGDRDQPAVPHRRRDRPEAPADQAVARQVRADDEDRSSTARWSRARRRSRTRARQPPDIDEVVLVGGSTRIPMVQKQVKEFFGKEPHKGVNPDEVVALGAAVQAGVLSGDVKDILLLDVTPLTLGIETLGGVMTPMIPRNTTIPTKKTETFSTASDGQTSVEVVVTQGERPMANDNRLLGKFQLDGIPPAPRGVPQIEVTFDIDANGIVNVHAKDKATDKEQKITITASSGLTEADIQKMVKDAEAHEAEDKERKEAIEARNQLDSLVFQMEKMVTENRDKIDEAARAEVERGIENAKKVLEANKDAGKDAAPFKTAFNELQQASYKMAEQMYKTAAPSGGWWRRRRRGRRRRRRRADDPGAEGRHRRRVRRAAQAVREEAVSHRAVSYGRSQNGRERSRPFFFPECEGRIRKLALTMIGCNRGEFS